MRLPWVFRPRNPTEQGKNSLGHGCIPSKSQQKARHRSDFVQAKVLLCHSFHKYLLSNSSPGARDTQGRNPKTPGCAALKGGVEEAEQDPDGLTGGDDTEGVMTW